VDALGFMFHLQSILHERVAHAPRYKIVMGDKPGFLKP
jgi:hypothetical protein